MKLSRLVCVLGLLSMVWVLASGVAAVPPASDCASSASGMFMIGDENAVLGSTVTFWGAQWWKLNSVSGGGAPPSFKGFALNVASDCFTTDPGNSPPPPQGPLPSTVTVLVTDSVQKSGQTISGTIIGKACVMTDPGYEANPGHAGTGTVTALLGCPGE